jgi:ABC-type glycerol-3-phosphate transport system substrate-binding protein
MTSPRTLLSRTLASLLFLLALPLHSLAEPPPPPIQLELWTWALRPWFNAYMADLTSSFEATHPGVKVLWVDIPGDSIIRKYYAAGAAGRLPDVVNLPDKTFLQFANLGGVEPLDNLLPGDPKDVYVKPGLDQCRINGRLLALPYYLSSDVCLLNTQLLAQGGLTPDTAGSTWDELLAQARPFRTKTGKHLFNLRLGEVELVSMITAYGLSPITQNPDGSQRSNLLSPDVVALMEKWVKAYHDGDLPREAATADYPATVQSFKEQSVAILNADAVRSVKDDTPRLYDVLAIRPGITGPVRKINFSATVIAVSPQSRHKKLAAELAWHITSAPWQERLCRQASRVPATISSLKLPEFSIPADPSDKLKLALGIGCDQLLRDRAMSFIPPTGQWPRMEDLFADEIKRCLLERSPVRESLTRIDRAWNKLLTEEYQLTPHSDKTSHTQ